MDTPQRSGYQFCLGSDEGGLWVGAESDYQTIIAGVTNVNVSPLTIYNEHGFSIMDKPATTASDSVYLMKSVR